MYYHHSGYIGGIKAKTAKELLEKKPETDHRKGCLGNAPEKQARQGDDKKIKSIQGG